MTLNSCGLALAAAATLIASAASADLRGPGMAGSGLSTSTDIQRRLGVSGFQTTLQDYGRRMPVAADPALASSLDRAFPWLPAEMIDGVDALRFDRLDPRTGERTVFADATWRPFGGGRAR